MVVNEHMVLGAFLVALDLGGTFVFAISGAAAGVKHRLDLFGVLVLAFLAGNFGGITRDILIGAMPPVAINDWRYVSVSLVAGVIVFFWYPAIDGLRSPVQVFDSIGLALFAVVLRRNSVRTKDLAGYGELRSKLKTPIALHLGSPRAMIEAIRANVCTIFNTGPSPSMASVSNAYLAGDAGMPGWHGSGHDSEYSTRR